MTLYILPLRLCRFRFGMRFCTFFLIFIPLHFTHVCGSLALNRTHKASCFFASAMWRGSEHRCMVIPSCKHVFAAGSRRRSKTQTLGCQEPDSVVYQVAFVVTDWALILILVWLTSEELSLGTRSRIRTNYHVPARWCQEAWLAPLICLHLGCKLGISDVFGFGTVESVGGVHGFYCIENKFLWPVYHNTSSWRLE